LSEKILHKVSFPSTHKLVALEFCVGGGVNPLHGLDSRVIVVEFLSNPLSKVFLARGFK